MLVMMTDMENFVLKGPPSKYPLIKKGIGEFFFEQAEKYPNNIMQIDGITGKQETYSDVKRRSTKFATYLQSLDIKPKDIITICCQNSLDQIIPALASLYLGAYISFIDPKQQFEDVENVFQTLEPKIIVAEKNSLELIQKVIEKVSQKPHLVIIGDTNGKYPDMWQIEKNTDFEAGFQPIKQNGSEVAIIFFSSGTTSTPKPICVSSFSLLSVINSVIQHNLNNPKVTLIIASLYWISAWGYTISCIGHGSTRVITNQVNGEIFLELIDKYKVTTLFCTPLFSYLVTNLDKATIEKYDTSSLYSILCGGSTMDPKQLIKLRTCLPHTYCNLGYGSTECNFLIGHNYAYNLKASQEKLTSSGCLLPDTQIKFMDLDTEKALGPNQPGEMYAKSPYLMSGYYKFSKPDIFDKDGFLKTGDLGYYDEDQYIYIVDRIGESFKYQMERISPEKIENCLMQHPAVKEAAAFGIPHAVDRHHIAASVSLKPGLKASAEELIEFVNSQMNNVYQIRAGLKIWDQLPKTPTGKLQRRMAREKFIKEIGAN